MAKSKFFLSFAEMGVEHRDAGPWRSYQLCACGNDLHEMLEDAHVFEMDQDGGEMGDYKLSDAPENVRQRGIAMIVDLVCSAAHGDILGVG